MACSSKHKAKDLDTNVDMATPVRGDSVIGVKDGDMVYQRKVAINEELRTLELDVYNLEAKVMGGPPLFGQSWALRRFARLQSAIRRRGQ